jgi:hypothetical protein
MVGILRFDLSRSRVIPVKPDFDRFSLGPFLPAPSLLYTVCSVDFCGEQRILVSSSSDRGRLELVFPDDSALARMPGPSFCGSKAAHVIAESINRYSFNEIWKRNF